MTSLAIIIVSYNARADLERCLDSLASAPPAHSEVVVVDNASTDGSPDAARRHPGVQLIQMSSNRGFAAANNVGIRATESELVLLLNSDTIVPSGAIDRLVSTLVSHQEVGVAGPRLVDGEGRAELSFGSMIGPIVEWRRQRLMRALARQEPGAVSRVSALTREQCYPDWVSGACLLVRRRDAEAVGLLDERYFMYTEDVDFCTSVRRLGRRVLFTPSAEVVHLRGRSGAADAIATRQAYRRSHLAFYQKHYPLLAPFLRLYQAIRG